MKKIKKGEYEYKGYIICKISDLFNSMWEIRTSEGLLLTKAFMTAKKASKWIDSMIEESEILSSYEVADYTPKCT